MPRQTPTKSRLANASLAPVSAAGARRILPSASAVVVMPCALPAQWRSRAIGSAPSITTLYSLALVVSASGKGFAIAKQHQAVAWYAPASPTRFAFT
jgi:hypothetical protein